ncbi:site-specific integrase [Neopusillimonas maritima]|uniref:Tyr recombinase domain-containing protein n=1 Tax=Neopusillimonas maritima TaxID=2026239 RepID=A0ABX9MXY9_9BURK|nr:site-specific integrase [Neopusillimonas maritima]RII83840.1 hypothetical protein CJO09_00945 [Neopusillimonas maritima]
MGTIVKTNAGTFLGRVRMKGYSLARTFDDRTDARAWVQKTEASIVSGHYRDDKRAKRITLGELLEKYRIHVAPAKKGGEQEVRKLLFLEKQSFCSIRLAELRPIHFIQYRDRRLKEVRPATTKNDLAVLSAVINHARKEWQIYLPENPLELVKKPTVRNSRTRTLSETEVHWLRQAMAPREFSHTPDGRFACQRIGPELLWAFELSIETGMRRSELLGLRWEDVHLSQTGFCWVRIIDTKNGENRDVPLTLAAESVMREAAVRRDKKSIKVFSMSPNALRLRWLDALERAKKLYAEHCQEAAAQPVSAVFEDLRWHDIRHSAITRLASLVPDSLELSRISGHKTLSMLRRYYNPSAADLAGRLNRPQLEKLKEFQGE